MTGLFPMFVLFRRTWINGVVHFETFLIVQRNQASWFDHNIVEEQTVEASAIKDFLLLNELWIMT